MLIRTYVSIQKDIYTQWEPNFVIIQNPFFCPNFWNDKRKGWNDCNTLKNVIRMWGSRSPNFAFLPSIFQQQHSVAYVTNIFHIRFSTRIGNVKSRAWDYDAYVTVLARTRHSRVFGLSTRYLMIVKPPPVQFL